jgi:hypothetical protein
VCNHSAFSELGKLNGLAVAKTLIVRAVAVETGATFYTSRVRACPACRGLMK